jgi:hypothetical protein
MDVLIDSEATKLEAFDVVIRRLLDPSDTILDEIRRSNAAQRGVPRRTKFEHAVGLVERRGDAAAVQDLLDAYASLLAERLPLVGAMPGARQFVTAVAVGRS